MLFLILDYKDFIQLCFMPIEDQTMLKTVRNGVRSFEIIQYILKRLTYGYKDTFKDLSKCPQVQIRRSDLINSGIPNEWFLDSLPVGRDTIQSQNFNCQNLR